MGYRIAGLVILLVEGGVLWFYTLNPVASTQSNAMQMAASIFAYLIPLALFTGSGLLLLGRYFYRMLTGKVSNIPASFSVIMVISLLILGLPLKFRIDEMVAALRYSSSPHPANVTLREPVSVRYEADSIDITAANGKHYRISWAKLYKINLIAIVGHAARFESKPPHYIYWEFLGTDNSRIAIPIGVVDGYVMQQEIRVHAGPILEDPIYAIQNKINQHTHSTFAHTVWTRKWSSSINQQPH